MSETQTVRCTACPDDDREFAVHTWRTHAKSKKHVANDGNEHSYEVVGAPPEEEEEIEVPPIPPRPELSDEDLMEALKRSAATLEETVTDPIDEAAATFDDPEEVRNLRLELAEMQEKLALAEAQAKEWRPDVDVMVYETPEQAYEFMGRERLLEIAESALANQNKERIKKGLPPLYTGEPAEYQRLIEKEIAQTCVDLVRERTKWVDAKSPIPQRVLKMVKPDGNVVQIPVELQINNGKGSLADPIERYKRKGFKLPTPTLCNLRDCHNASAVSNGKYLFQGYCSEQHMRIVEGGGSGRNQDGETRMIDLAARV